MFQFTTTTVINNLKDFTTGKDLIEVKDNVIRIKRHNPFVKENISCMYKAEAEAAVCDVATISGLAEAEKDMRVQLYIRSIGNADPMYANSLVFKGKPMNIEVPAGTTADKLVEIANKYLNLVFGGEAQLVASLSGSGSDLVLTCVNPFQRITKVTVAERAIEKNYGHGAMVAEFGDGEDKTADYVTVGTEGFGDYDHLLKDLRLPTGANLRWKRTMEDEMPVPGAMYNQYTLYYTVDRGVMGLHAVGAKATSQTTHVFWVNQNCAEDFEKFFTDAGVTLEEVKKKEAASEENTEAGA